MRSVVRSGPRSSLVRACSCLFVLAGILACTDTNPRDPSTGTVASGVGYGEIVNTTNAREWSSAVAIIHSSNPATDGTYGGRCTALLITPRLLLTASHCGDTGYASFFEYDASGGTRFATAQIDVETRFDFEHNTENNEKIDISLRKLVETAPVEPYWYPLSNTTESLAGTTIEVAGFGRTETGETSNVLRQGLECSVSRDVFTNTGHGGVTPDKRFDYDCTYPDPETSPESGDSGAPVFTKAGEVVGIHTNSSGSIGIAQYLGYAIEDGSRPYLDWIYSIIAAEDPDYYTELLHHHLGLPNTSSEAELLGRFAVFGEQAVELYDRASIDLNAGENQWSWGSRVEFGRDVECGAMLTGTEGASLGPRSSVAGNLLLTGEQVLEADAKVKGRQVYLDAIALPSLETIAWDGPASPDTSGTRVPYGERLDLTPGTYYGNLNVQAGAELNLTSCGKFYIKGLVVGPQAKLRLASDPCSTRINVQNGFRFAGIVEKASGGSVSASELLVSAWGYSEPAISLESSFVGTLMAVNGTIVVRAGQSLTGAALGTNIVVFEDARIIPEPGGMVAWFTPGAK